MRRNENFSFASFYRYQHVSLYRALYQETCSWLFNNRCIRHLTNWDPADTTHPRSLEQTLRDQVRSHRAHQARPLTWRENRHAWYRWRHVRRRTTVWWRQATTSSFQAGWGKDKTWSRIILTLYYCCRKKESNSDNIHKKKLKVKWQKKQNKTEKTTTKNWSNNMEIKTYQICRHM